MNENDTSRQSALIVESDPQKRQSLATIAADLDLVCMEAADGHQALDLIGEHMPSVIILNLTVPGAERLIDYETYKRLPALSAVPIVALSAYDSEAADWRGVRGLFPVGESLRNSEDDLRALIRGALNSPL